MHFINSKQEQDFYTNGYVILNNLFDSSDIIYFKNLLVINKKEYDINKGGTYSTYDAKNIDFINTINEEIKLRLKPKLDNILLDYDYLLSSFLIKEPGESNQTDFHQDPTMINKEPHISAGLWCPLQEVNTENGALKMIPGSHRFGKILVATPNCKTTYGKFKHKLDKFSVSIPLTLGQGVLFNNKTIHGSFPNHSELDRIAIVTALKSKESEWVYYYNDEELNIIEKYLLNFETYAAHTTGSRPKGVLLEKLTYQFEENNYFQFLSFMLKNYSKFTLHRLLNYKK